jgi:hypothetical protein
LSAIFTHVKLPEEDHQHTNMSLECIHFVNTAESGTSPELFTTLANTVVAGKDETCMSKSPPEYAEILSLLCDETSGREPSISGQIYSPRQLKGLFSLEDLKKRSVGRTFQAFKRAYRAAMLNRRLCWTQKGYLGLAPRYTRPGDIVCVFMGSAVPFVVRPREDGRSLLVGECYVHGVMDGQLADDESVDCTDIELV